MKKSNGIVISAQKKYKRQYKTTAQQDHILKALNVTLKEMTKLLVLYEKRKPVQLGTGYNYEEVKDKTVSYTTL